MDHIIGVLVFGLMVGAALILYEYWPIFLLLALISVVVVIAYNYEPPPDPRREIREAEQEAKQAINSAGKAYRKRVNDLTK